MSSLYSCWWSVFFTKTSNDIDLNVVGNDHDHYTYKLMIVRKIILLYSQYDTTDGRVFICACAGEVERESSIIICTLYHRLYNLYVYLCERFGSPAWSRQPIWTWWSSVSNQTTADRVYTILLYTNQRYIRCVAQTRTRYIYMVLDE